MQCIKTGGWAFLSEYGHYVRGDIYTTPKGTVLMRVIDVHDNYKSVLPETEKVWVTIRRVGGDFSDHRVQRDVFMKTIIADHATVHYHWVFDAQTDGYIAAPIDVPAN